MSKATEAYELGLLARSKLRVLSRIFPVRDPGKGVFTKQSVSMGEARISNIEIPKFSRIIITSNLCQPQETLSVNIPTLSHPGITSDLCLSGIDPRNIDFLLNEITTEDFTDWLKLQLLAPEIESIPVSLLAAKVRGKAYMQSENETVQAELFPHEPDEDCMHGLKSNWCSICRDKKREEAGHPVSMDIFDIIFPILLPPLGENIDSPMAFPEGQDLYDFQRTGVKFLVEHENALLADEMGLGKSIQAIVALRFLFRMGKISNGLVLCPKSVLSDWEKKIWDWAPELRVLKVRGSKEQRAVKWETPAHIYLTTYETLRGDLYNSNSLQVSDRVFSFIILDEIQKIKNPGAQITQATRGIDAEIRWGLSGTPFQNRLEELVSIFSYLKPGLLHKKDVENPRGIQKAIKPYFLRRRKADVLDDLPEKVAEERWLELSPSQREAYDIAERNGIIYLKEKGEYATVQHVLALITRLKLICNVDPESGESCKLDFLLEELGTITEDGSKALVFSQYPGKTLRILEPKLIDFDPLLFDGKLTDRNREKTLEAFEIDDSKKILLIGVKAGGEGLTLTRANYVYHFDLWWNPFVAHQAEDRAHRIGQKKTVFVTYLYAKETVEEKIHRILSRKLKIFRQVVDELAESKLSKVLTEEEFFGLFGMESPKGARKEKASEDDLLSGLESISPEEFELLIAKLYDRMGYDINLTPRSRDGGIDIHAKRLTEVGTECFAIQCKHYLGRSVGVDHARSLYGVIQAQSHITKGILVTSGRFSADCREFAARKRLELFDGPYICGLLVKYDVSLDF